MASVTTVRPGRPDDLDTIEELLRAAHAQEATAGIPVDPQKARTVVLQHMAHAFCQVAEREGLLVGVMLGHMEELWYARHRRAVDLVLYAESGGLLLIRSFIQWATAQDAREITLGISSRRKPGRVAELYERIGFPQAGTFHTVIVGGET
jgi:L-amino acid N-acyltransferase YncA